MNLNLAYYGCSDIGLVRKNNEDVWEALPVQQLFILADGMGGHRAGEIAAQEAVTALADYFTQLPSPLESIENAALLLEEAIRKANSRVYTLSAARNEWRGMGTTLCCALIHHRFLLCGHVGDSRIYRFRHYLEQLTQDHSLKQQLLDRSATPSIEPSLGAFKNILTRAIGTHREVEPEIKISPIEIGDIYLICSDGLSDAVADTEIAEILKASPSLSAAGSSLITAAKSRGGTDNITLLLIQVH